jgi:hypothetical protein
MLCDFLTMPCRILLSIRIYKRPIIPYEDFHGFTLVSSDKCWYSASDYTTDVSLHIISRFITE